MPGIALWSIPGIDPCCIGMEPWFIGMLPIDPMSMPGVDPCCMEPWFIGMFPVEPMSIPDIEP